MEDTAGIPPSEKTFWKFYFLILFGVAMGYLEAAVVVYLRDLYYPGGFEFPLRMIGRRHLAVELGRELATIVMLVSVARLAGRSFRERLALFLIVFAVWDIFYYVWLKVLLGWPASLLDWDILFLIPIPWVGPVLSPLLVSLSMAAGGVLILRRLWSGGVFAPSLGEWFFALAGAVLIVLSYTIDLQVSLRSGEPESYRWDMLLAGLAVGFYAVFRSLRRTGKGAVCRG